MADMRATKEWAELEKILAEFERLELGSEAMGLATNFANQVGWLGPGPCHGIACPVRTPGVNTLVRRLRAAPWMAQFRHGFFCVRHAGHRLV
jgi:hypothetical protein